MTLQLGMTTQSILEGNILVYTLSDQSWTIWSKTTKDWNLWIITFPGQADNKKEFKLHKKSKPFAYWSVHPGAFYKGESYLTFFAFLVTKKFLAASYLSVEPSIQMNQNHSSNSFHHMVFQQRWFLFFPFFLNHTTFLLKLYQLPKKLNLKSNQVLIQGIMLHRGFHIMEVQF